MGRSPNNSSSSIENNEVKKGPWTPEEDQKLIDFIEKHGHGSWKFLPEKAGLNRCGKSCRLRWTNYLRPDIKRGNFTPKEEQTIIDLHSVLGNKWSTIATHLPGRTDNEIKNFWNTHLRKKLLRSGIDPKTHHPLMTVDHQLNSLLNLPIHTFPSSSNPPLMNNPNLDNLAKIQILFNILQVINTTPFPNTKNSTNCGSSQLINHYPPLKNELLDIPNLPNFNTLLFPNNIDQHYLHSFSKVPEIPQQEKNNVIINNTIGEFSLPELFPVTPEISSSNQVQSSCTLLPNPNNIDSSDMFLETTMEDEANSSFWKDIFDESFPAPFV